MTFPLDMPVARKLYYESYSAWSVLASQFYILGKQRRSWRGLGLASDAEHVKSLSAPMMMSGVFFSSLLGIFFLSVMIDCKQLNFVAVLNLLSDLDLMSEG